LRPRELGQEPQIRMGAVARDDVRRAKGAPDDPLGQVALLVRRGPADDRGRVLARLAKAGRGGLERLAPPHRHELAAPADHRLRYPVRRLDRLVAEPPLVAQPPVVDLDVVTCQDALDALVANRQLDVALARAERADGPGVL